MPMPSGRRSGLPSVVILCVIWTLFFAGWQLLGLP